MNSIKIVTLAYSILYLSIEDIEDKINHIVLDLKKSFKDDLSNIKILFSLQGSKDYFLEIKNKINKKYENIDLDIIYSGDKGLCKSRNNSIKNTNSYFIHFLDADCRFNFNNLERKNYLKKLNTNKDCIVFLKSPLINFKKSFSMSLFLESINLKIKNNFFNFLKSAISMPSYAIIIPKFYFDKYNLAFDEKLGLGTKLNQSEEICLLLNIFKKNPKLKFIFIYSKGFSAESKSHITNRSQTLNQMLSKGYVVNNVMPVTGILILPFISFLFYLKFRRIISLLDAFIYIYKGYFKIY